LRGQIYQSINILPAADLLDVLGVVVGPRAFKVQQALQQGICVLSVFFEGWEDDEVAYIAIKDLLGLILIDADVYQLHTLSGRKLAVEHTKQFGNDEDFG
jgi:hypothetical protein